MTATQMQQTIAADVQSELGFDWMKKKRAKTLPAVAEALRNFECIWQLPPVKMREAIAGILGMDDKGTTLTREQQDNPIQQISRFPWILQPGGKYMKAVSDDWAALLKANTELKGMTIGTTEEADATRALPQFQKLVQYGAHWLDKATDNTMRFIDRLPEREQREKGRSFWDTMLLEQTDEEARQSQVNPDHGKLTIEDRILLTTAKHEALEATRRTLNHAGMAETSAGGRERRARNWDIDADTHSGARRGRDLERREKPPRGDEWKRRGNKEGRSRSRERERKPQPREESDRRGRQQSREKDRPRERKPPREKELKGAPMSDEEIGRAVDRLPSPIEGTCET